MSKIKLDEKPLTYLCAIALGIVTVGFLAPTIFTACGSSALVDGERLDDLRTVGIDFSRADAAEMIKSYGFYDVNLNARGRGIENDFVLLPGDSVVRASTTGLFWQQSGSSQGLSFEGAQEYIQSLNDEKFAGYSDWRLPTLEEAMSLMEPKRESGLFIDPVFDEKQWWIWTPDIESSRAWGVYFFVGACVNFHITNLYYVRAVR